MPAWSVETLLLYVLRSGIVTMLWHIHSHSTMAMRNMSTPPPHTHTSASIIFLVLFFFKLANQIAARLMARAEEVVFSEYMESAYAEFDPECLDFWEARGWWMTPWFGKVASDQPSWQ